MNAGPTVCFFRVVTHLAAWYVGKSFISATHAEEQLNTELVQFTISTVSPCRFKFRFVALKNSLLDKKLQGRFFFLERMNTREVGNQFHEFTLKSLRGEIFLPTAAAHSQQRLGEDSHLFSTKPPDERRKLCYRWGPERFPEQHRGRTGTALLRGCFPH